MRHIYLFVCLFNIDWNGIPYKVTVKPNKAWALSTEGKCFLINLSLRVPQQLSLCPHSGALTLLVLDQLMTKTVQGSGSSNSFFTQHMGNTGRSAQILYLSRSPEFRMLLKCKYFQQNVLNVSKVKVHNMQNGSVAYSVILS